MKTFVTEYAKKWGYVRPLKRLLEDKQRFALKAAGADPIFVESKDESLEHFKEQQTFQPGDMLMVYRLYVLAPPRIQTNDKPRDALWETVEWLTSRRVTIFEVDTGRSSETTAGLMAMMRDAIEQMTSGSRGDAGRENGPKSMGRKPTVWTPEQIEQARTAWFSRKHRTNEDAISASPEGWYLWRSMKMFGPSLRGEK
jgi:hypothetical protein